MELLFIVNIVEWLENIGFSTILARVLIFIVYMLIIIFLAYIADIVTRKVIISVITRIVKKTKTSWDDIIVRKKVFNRLSHLAPAIIIYYMIGFAIDVLDLTLATTETITSIIQSACKVYMIIIGLMVVDAFFTALHEIYLTFEISKQRPIKGYVQVVKIFFYFIGIILILSVLMNEEPGRLLTGLGAVAAVLLLVFKDTILGFVASIQLSANKMVNPGDWISMPDHNADGVVLEINLNTVKVQNWDKTIATIPTYALVSESFKNWKGMEESGGRRIKRALNIDVKSIKFCDEKLLEKFKKIHFLKDYILNRQKEIDEYNAERKIDVTIPVNGRRLTNVGVFRKYVEEYLKNHPKIHNNMTFLVRQLQPTEKGLPIEIYVFSNDQAWANYEAIQSDIFDHILAIIPEFELNVFQNPTGSDFSKIIQ